MNTEDTERATTCFVVVYFSRCFITGQSGSAYFHYVLHVYMTCLYYIGIGALYQFVMQEPSVYGTACPLRTKMYNLLALLLN